IETAFVAKPKALRGVACSRAPAPARALPRRTDTLLRGGRRALRRLAEHLAETLERALEITQMDVRPPLHLPDDVHEDQQRPHGEQGPAAEAAGEHVRNLPGLQILAAGLVPAEEQRHPAGHD